MYPMQKYIIALALFLISTAAQAADNSSLDIAPAPKARSADQMECLKANADNHQGYLACIRAKKGLKDDDSANSKTAPNTVPLDGGMSSGIR